VNRKPSATEPSHLAYDILAYLAEHPGADDTLEGIVHWWVLEQKIKRLTIGVEIALSKLVAQGLLLEHSRKDGRTHYRINRRKVREIQNLLEQGKKQEQGSL
jgi:Tfp pilus assembly ATPase PilU